jgi:hypothetical protein
MALSPLRSEFGFIDFVPLQYADPPLYSFSIEKENEQKKDFEGAVRE